MKRSCCPADTEVSLPPVRPACPLYRADAAQYFAVMSLERRQRIIEIARQYDVTIIEDDVFGLMPRHLRRSKLWRRISPSAHQQPVQEHRAGLRIGYLVAPSRLMPPAGRHHAGRSTTRSAADEQVASRWIEDGSADQLQRCPAPRVPDTPQKWRRKSARLAGPDRRAFRRPASLAGLSRSSLAAPGTSFRSPPARRDADRRRCLHGWTGRHPAVRVGLSMPMRREDVRHGLEVIAELRDEASGRASLSVV